MRAKIIKAKNMPELVGEHGNILEEKRFEADVYVLIQLDNPKYERVANLWYSSCHIERLRG